MTDKAFETTNRRYQALVDRKYLFGLTAEEDAELERLGLLLDEHFAPFHDAAMACIEAAIAAREEQ